MSRGRAGVVKGTAADDDLRGAEGDDTLAGGRGADRLDGRRGSDTASYVNAEGAVRVDLRLTTAQDTGADGLDTLIAIENLIGSRFEDVLIGNSGANRLAGGRGADTLTGGDGADVFVFEAVSHSRPREADRITDFVSGQDKVDLSAIDANTERDGDQAFRFIGAAEFSGRAGELRAVVSGGVTTVRADVDGDRKADLQIVVENAGVSKASDFVLHERHASEPMLAVEVVGKSMRAAHLMADTDVPSIVDFVL